MQDFSQKLVWAAIAETSIIIENVKNLGQQRNLRYIFYISNILVIPLNFVDYIIVL